MIMIMIMIMIIMNIYLFIIINIDNIIFAAELPGRSRSSGDLRRERF